MKTHTFFVENLKCNGCAKTIRKEASKFSSTKSVTVDPEQSIITLELDDDLDELEQIKLKLAKIGYPEMGADNNILTTAKSYVSCAIGRIGV